MERRAFYTRRRGRARAGGQGNSNKVSDAGFWYSPQNHHLLCLLCFFKINPHPHPRTRSSSFQGIIAFDRPTYLSFFPYSFLSLIGHRNQGLGTRNNGDCLKGKSSTSEILLHAYTMFGELSQYFNNLNCLIFKSFFKDYLKKHT